MRRIVLTNDDVRTSRESGTATERGVTLVFPGLPVRYHLNETQRNYIIHSHLGMSRVTLPADSASQKEPASRFRPAASTQRSRSSAARCLANPGRA